MKIEKLLNAIKPALIVISAMFLSTTVYASAGFELITIDEYQKALDEGDNPAHDLMPKAVPNGPAIEVVSPTVTNGALPSPVDIEVQFKSAEGAKIDMSSLKIYYLMFIKKDVTKRILEHAEIGADSIKAVGAQLPGGKHKFLLEISDNQKRKSSQKFIVEVDA